MDLPRGNRHVRESTLSSVNGASGNIVTATADNNANVSFHIANAGPDSALPLSEALTRPRRLPTETAGTQSASSPTSASSSLRNLFADDAHTRHSPARALFLFELICAILDATTSLASASSSTSLLNQTGQQASAGTMTSSSQSSSMAGYLAQHLTVAIAATRIANAEQEHYGSRGSGRSSTTVAGLGDRGAHIDRTQRPSLDSEREHHGVVPFRYGRRDGLSSAVLGYRVGDIDGDRYEDRSGSSINDPQTRRRFTGWENRLSRDGDVEDDWDLDDDEQFSYAIHAAAESTPDDYDERWEEWVDAHRSGPQSESRFPSFGSQRVPENGVPSRREESQHDDDDYRAFLYRYHDTLRPLLSRRNRVRGGLLAGAFTSPSDRLDMFGPALPLLPLHMPFSDGNVPSQNTIEILDANGILIDAPVPSHRSHADRHGDGSESVFQFVRPLTRGGLTMTAPLRGSGDDRIERQGPQRIHSGVEPYTERSRFHLGVDRRHPATCFESKTTDASCNGDFSFDVSCARYAAAIPLFYRLSCFKNTRDHLTPPTETRITPQYYRYWHPNTG